MRFCILQTPVISGISLLLIKTRMTISFPFNLLTGLKVPPTISHRPLDMYVTGKYTFFCLEPQNGVPLYTHDGRFYKDPDGLLRSVAHHLPVMGQKGRIYLSTNEPEVDQYGVIFENDVEIDQFKIQKYASSKGLWTIEGTVFYERDPEIVEVSDESYEIFKAILRKVMSLRV